MAKKVTVPHMPSLQGEPIDIPNSPEKGGGYGAMINETERLVTKTLRGLRKEKEAQEEVTKKTTTSSLDTSLRKQQLIVKIGKMKQEIEEYQVLDGHIKAENAQLK
jgi:hypothetical protein